MPLIHKANYPALSQSTSMFQTRVENPTAHVRQYPTKVASGNVHSAPDGTRETVPDPLPRAAPPAASTVEKFSRFQSYKLVSNRVKGDYPASTGTSKTNYPCLTNSLGPCVAVMMTGASEDETKRNARIFHVDSRNTKATETLKAYKKFLTGNDLKNISAVLVGGCVDPEQFKKMIPNISDETAKQFADQGRMFANELREVMTAENIPIIKDEAGENRPASVTGASTVGFKLKQEGEKIKFEYLQNVIR